MTIRITHPLPIQGEVQANGLTFIDGVAETDADLSDIQPLLEEHGFTVESVGESAAERQDREASETADAERIAAAQKAAATQVSEAPQTVVAEKVDQATEITAENAGVVQTADGAQHVGEIPAEAADEDAAG